MYSNGIQSYRKTNVVTADPKRLVLMCYEGAIDSLKIGKQRLLKEDYEGKGKALTKAKDIIHELKSSLNFEEGGTIAKDLDSLYNYMLMRIMHGDNEKDVEALEEVVGMLGDLRSAWEEMFYDQKNTANPEVAAPRGERAGEIVSYSGV